MAAQVIVPKSEIRNCGEIVGLLKNSHRLNVQVVHEFCHATFLLSSRCAAIRLKSSEFVKVNQEKKIVKIVQTMNDYFDRPYLILEGDSGLRTIYGDSIVSLLARSNIRVLYSTGSSETAKLVFKMSEFEEEKGHILYWSPDMPQSVKSHFKFYVNLPGLNFAMALQLCYEFDSPAEFMHADPNEIADKMPEVTRKLENIRSFCDATFQGNVDK